MSTKQACLGSILALTVGAKEKKVGQLYFSELFTFLFPAVRV
jgi:hypothetical protein